MSRLSLPFHSVAMVCFRQLHANESLWRFLPDDGLLVVRVNAQGFLQPHHFWPASVRLEPLPGEIPAGSFGSRLAVFPDGKEVAFLGFVGQMERNVSPKLVVLDLKTKQWRLREQFPALDIAWPVGLAVGPDGQEILASIPAGDLNPVVAIPRFGNRSLRSILPLAESPGFIDTGRDGSLSLDQWPTPVELLRFSSTGSILERLAGRFLAWGGRRLPGPDDRILFPSSSEGHFALLIGKPAEDAHPFVQTDQEAGVPVALLGGDEVAFLLGSFGGQTITVTSLADGRILRRITGRCQRSANSDHGVLARWSNDLLRKYWRVGSTLSVTHITPTAYGRGSFVLGPKVHAA